MEIEVAYALPEKQALLKVIVPEGCTVQEAIVSSNIQAEFPGVDIDCSVVGIFSRKVTPDHVLKDGDRVEIYRPLIADPKEMRKQRALAKNKPD
ncbi:RnfH family protein [Pseudomonadota bacterium]